MSRQLKREPDFVQFLRVLQRQQRPERLTFYEHVCSPSFISRRTGTNFHELSPYDEAYWPIYVDFWLGLGYDCIPMEIGLRVPVKPAEHKASRGSEGSVTIQTMEDFEKHPWPDVADPIDFSHFERVTKLLPEGVKIVGGVGGGPYEWVSMMMGVQGLSMAIYLDPELVERMFAMIDALHASADRQLATMEAIGALRQGDDLGFKTSTFLCPEHLRRYIFPTYKKMVQAAHDNGKPFILHSCGNLAEVYEDLIEDVKIDAKHSFEDVILPVDEFKQQYGRRVTPLGGLDVDKICRLSEPELRAYTRRMVEACWSDGFWALGTGNSLTDYMPVENYLMVLDEGLKVTGSA